MEKSGYGSISLIDLVFSWSIQDVLNSDLYKAQVKKIPVTFNSTAEYFNSFVAPLIEETHADLLESMTKLYQAPSNQVYSVERDKNYNVPTDLFYKIVLRKMKDSNRSDLVTYHPQSGDLAALTDVKPKSVSDLNRPRMPYLLAYVQAVDDDELSILLSKPILIEQEMQRKEKLLEQSSQKKHSTVFFVFLTNMTTYIRIWKALHSDLIGGNLKMINKVIQMNGADEEDCAICLSVNDSIAIPSFKSYGLNDSQEAAITSCINTWGCCHQNTVKLIWGPPGTGKTKTVGILLFALLRIKCRTITCAPTHVAVKEVASRLMGSVTGTLEYETYGFGDIVLLGSSERMRIEGHENLLHVFLNYRVAVLYKCFSPSSGWNTSLDSMIDLLENPDVQYCRYLANRELGFNSDDENHEMKDENSEGKLRDNESSNQEMEGESYDYAWKKVINEILNRKETKKKKVTHEKEEDRHGASMEEKKSQEAETCKDDDLLTIEGFVKKRFSVYNERLKFCVVNLYTHLPTKVISLQVVKNMMVALDLLRSLETLLNCSNFGDEELRKTFNDTEKESEVGHLGDFRVTRKSCLPILKSLARSFRLPNFTQKFMIKNFCLDNACLLFSTISSSSILNTERTQPLDLLVIDEASQLKECESAIPFQLPGLRHAVLIGDERQLPAVVKSKISEKAEFGRSMFERLVLLGQKKQLFNVQYRMHPAISSFPNKEFYGGLILDAPIVRHRSHEKRFLHGNMYGAYSFINVALGKEQFDQLHSKKNLVEVAVVCRIVASLFKEFTGTKQSIRIGVISPYIAQVHAIQEKLEKKYTGYSNSGFAVSIRSVDGFQGGEADVIIISTVRSNIYGSVGFLSNRRRANVALTRARHCLWILGNEATYVKSNSVWTKLVTDAKRRGCFFNAEEDNDLAEAIITALIELQQFDTILSMDFPLFKQARWRVCLGNDFRKSVANIKDKELHKQMINLLEKLASGWRRGGADENNKQIVVDDSCFGLLEVYPINGGNLNLLWSVDIIKENSEFIQILKVWDILPLLDIPKAAQNLGTLFGGYTVNKISRCKNQCLEGNLVVPMKWAVEDRLPEVHEDDKMQGLSTYGQSSGNNNNSLGFYYILAIVIIVIFLAKYLPWPIFFFIGLFIYFIWVRR